MSFTSKYTKQIESSKRHNVFLIRSEDKGLECWHYVLVDNLKAPILRAVMKQLPRDIDVADYGRIIISGWGENPSEEVKAKVDAGDYEFEKPGNGYNIFHVNPKSNDNEEFFAFIAVPEPLAEKFNYLMNKEGSQMNLHEWGRVLKWGWGKATAKEIAELHKEFEFA